MLVMTAAPQHFWTELFSELSSAPCISFHKSQLFLVHILCAETGLITPQGICVKPSEKLELEDKKMRAEKWAEFHPKFLIY